MSIEVGRNNDYGIDQCPICGKDHHCFVTSDSDGNLFYGCNYTDDGINVHSNFDGKFYMYIGLSYKGVSKYEEANQHYMRTNTAADKDSFEPSKKPEKKGPKEIKNLVQPLTDSKLDEIYSYLFDNLILEEYHRCQLLSDGWSEEYISTSNIRSFPPADYIRRKGIIKYKNPLRKDITKKLFKKYGDLTGVPGLYLAQSKYGNYWNFSLKESGMLIPQFNMQQEMYRLRLRFDILPKKGGKYRNFSSYFVEKDTDFNVFEKGCQSNSNLSFYYDSDSDWSKVIIVEGEKKAYIAHKVLGHPTISLPGVSTYRKIDEMVIAFLLANGTKMLFLSYDADKVSNKDVRKPERNALIYLRKFLPAGTLEWPIIWGKGIDDILLKNYMPDFEYPLVR